MDIGGLVILIALELIKALRYAAQNRILQSKVYLDEATGLPNKNKCEEILNASDLLSAQDAVAICVFDLNNLRNINNNLGHDKGMNISVPLQYSCVLLLQMSILLDVMVVMNLSLS